MTIPDRLGDYSIVEEIGRGGFGIVYRAHQVSLDRPVALKVLYQHRVHTEDEVARFEREARAAARLDHDSIVSVYAWGEDDGNFFIAQRLVGCGRTMADRLNELREAGEPPKGYYRQLAECLARVAEGLQHAHERGIVHRDIKPSNILLDDEDRPYLGDFGLAKVEDGLELSRTGDFAGSPFYMSPEQADARRGRVDQRTDVYSLGVTLFELLTLRQPFNGRSSHEIIRRILTEDPRPPTKLAPRVPADLETICLKAMEKEPSRRYQSAEEFARDLHAFLDGEPISAVPAGTVTRVWKKARRHRATVGLVVLAVALCGVVLWGQVNRRARRSVEHQATAAGEVSRSKERTIRNQVDDQIDPVIQQALQDKDFERAQEAIDRKKELVELIEEGSDFVSDLIPEIEDNTTLQVIGESLQNEFLTDGLKTIETYLRTHPEDEDVPDPRLEKLSSWLVRATEELEELEGFSIGDGVPEATDPGASDSTLNESPTSSDTDLDGATDDSDEVLVGDEGAAELQSSVPSSPARQLETDDASFPAFGRLDPRYLRIPWLRYLGRLR